MMVLAFCVPAVVKYCPVLLLTAPLQLRPWEVQVGLRVLPGKLPVLPLPLESAGAVPEPSLSW